MFDASTPPIQRPPNVATVPIAGGYIGGNTPHVWTDQEWDALPQKQRLPIYVCSHPELHDPNVEATKAIKWLDDHHVPVGVWVALDLETAVNPPFIRTFDAKVVASGRLLIIYGSKSTIFQNPLTSGGYWVADWTGVSHLVSRSTITQYASDTMLRLGYDLNTVDDSVRFWQIGDPPMSATGPASWDPADWKAYWLKDPPSKYPDKPASNLAEALGYWPDGGLKGIRNTVEDIQTRLAVVEAAVQAGMPINLTDPQLIVLGTNIAIELATRGLKLSGTGTFSGPITLGADG